MHSKLFQERIRTLRKEAGISQKNLAEKLGISQQALSKYESGQSTPNPQTLFEIAEILHMTVDELMRSGNGTYMPSSIPVLGNVAAGQPIDAIEEAEDRVPMSYDLPAGDYFALRIKGRSMEPRMKDRDVVIVRRQEDVESGEIAVVLVENQSATCKQIEKRQDGLVLISTNPLFTPMYYSWEEVENLPVKVLGRVMELRSKY